METLLLQALRSHGLPEPVLQFEVHDHLGAFVGAASMPRTRMHCIAIEYDSKQEHSDEFQLARDARRRNAIAAAGYFMLARSSRRSEERRQRAMRVRSPDHPSIAATIARTGVNISA